MHGPSSNPARGVLCLILLTASLLSFGSAASADWLVTRDGAAVETRGAWEVRGEMVVFTSPSGVFSSLPLSEVNLSASEAHTQEMVNAAAGTSETEEPVRRQAVMVLTDADVRHVDVETPTGESAEELAEAVPATPSETGSSLAVTAWEEDYNVDENTVEITGSLRNSGRNPATSINLSVVLYSDSGTLLGKKEARLAKAALSPGESTSFVASFTAGMTFSDAQFDIQSRGFQTRAATPEVGGEDLEPEGR